MEPNIKTYDDYKYVLQDAGTLSLGAKYSYAELMHDEDIPFKFKVIAEKYLGRDLEPETTLESQIYYLAGEGFAYECFIQLKTKVKFSMLKEKRGLFGKDTKRYATQVMPLKEFVLKQTEWKKEREVFIQEIILSKLALMTFSV